MITHVKTRASCFYFGVGAVSTMLALCAMALPRLASAATGTWTAGGAGTWDDTDTNWSGLPAGTPWDSTNGPTHTALFAADGDAAATSGIVYPGAINFSGNATINGAGNIGFGTTTSTITIDVANTKTGTINADILAVAADGGGIGNKLFKTGSGKLILAGTTQLVNDATHEHKGSFFSINGGGELEVTGTFYSIQQDPAATSRQYPTSLIGDTSSGNTLRVSGSGNFYTNDITMGSAGNDNNSIIVSSPGDISSPFTSYSMAMVGDATQLNMNSSGNNLQVLAGSYFQGSFTTAGGGGWTLGPSAGNDSNYILVDGAAAILRRSNSNFTTVGVNGSSNYVQVSNGGRLERGRIGIGMGTGDDNYMLITGTGSAYQSEAAGTNGFFEIGKLAGATGNNLRIEAGAQLDVSGTNASRIVGVGEVVGADNNYIRVTGASSTMNFIYTNHPLVIGGFGSSAVLNSGGDGNHLDVYNGGTLNLDNFSGSISTIISGSTALVLTGTNSAFNLGDGNAVATATVGRTTNYAAEGVVLAGTGAALNVNNGRLIAGDVGPTSLVSGGGVGSLINLVGTGYFSNSSTTLISSPITGVGDFHKEGAGTLELSSTSNTYSGDTYVDAGILQLDQIFLDDLADLYISFGSKMNLAFSGTDTIGALYLNGVPQPIGTYGRVGSSATFQDDDYFNNAPFPVGTFGDGILNVTVLGSAEVVPEPSTLGLAAVSLIGLGLFTWLRRRKGV